MSSRKIVVGTVVVMLTGSVFSLATKADDGVIGMDLGISISESVPRPPTNHDVFGPGIGMDAYGRPTVVLPAFGGPGSVLGPVIPDVFGPGIGMDASGKPVVVVPLP
jgi:hypothetical protein